MRLENPEKEVRVGDTGMTVMATPESDLDFRFYYQGRVAQRVLGVKPAQLVKALDKAYDGEIPDIPDEDADPDAEPSDGDDADAPTTEAGSGAPEGSGEPVSSDAAPDPGPNADTGNGVSEGAAPSSEAGSDAPDGSTGAASSDAAPDPNAEAAPPASPGRSRSKKGKPAAK